MVIWKYLLILLKTRRLNYTKEALIQLLQCHHLFSERKVSRFLNCQGRIGCDVPADVHMEHLNKRGLRCSEKPWLKYYASFYSESIKSYRYSKNVSTAFECGIERIKSASNHGTLSVEKDISKVLCLMREVIVFDKKEKRRHRSLTFRQGLVTSLDRKE